MTIPTFRRRVQISDPPTADLPQRTREILESTGAFTPFPTTSPEAIIAELEKGLERDTTPTDEELEKGRRASRAISLNQISTVAEAEVGAVLANLGLRDLEYEAALGGKTPDWYHQSEPNFFLDVYARVPGREAARWLVSDGDEDFITAVRESDVKQAWSTIGEKVSRYRTVVEELRMPFMIAIRSLPMTSVEEPIFSMRLAEDLESILEFYLAENPHLSAILLLDSVAEKELEVVTFENPGASHPCPALLRGPG